MYNIIQILWQNVPLISRTVWRHHINTPYRYAWPNNVVAFEALQSEKKHPELHYRNIMCFLRRSLVTIRPISIHKINYVFYSLQKEEMEQKQI
jgi:hypothetical protein